MYTKNVLTGQTEKNRLPKKAKDEIIILKINEQKYNNGVEN